MSTKVSQLIPKQLPKQQTSEAVRFVAGGNRRQVNKHTNGEPSVNLLPIYGDTPESQSIADGRLLQIPLDQLDANEQHRKHFEQNDIDGLAANIKELGLIQPLSVRYVEKTGRFEVIAGERRFRAAKQLGLVEVPCVIKEADEGKKSALQLAENLVRKNLNPIEEANAYRDVMKLNDWSVDQVAKYFGRNKRTVFRFLELLDLPASVQEQVASGSISPKAAREIGLVSTDEEKQTVATVVADQSLSSVQAKTLVQEMSGRKRKTRLKSKPEVRGGPKPIPFEQPDSPVRIIVVPKPGSTYHDVEDAMSIALDEVRLRIRNNRSI